MAGSPHGSIYLKDTSGIEEQIRRFPMHLREKHLKKAIKEAAEIFENTAKRNVREIKAEGRDRWGKVSQEPLKDTIKRRLERATQTMVRAKVFTDANNPLNQYAASVEFGHKMHVFGERMPGERVPKHPFWRPAMGSTRAPIERLIVRELKRALRTMRNA